MQALVVPDPVLTQVNGLLFRILRRKKDCNRKAFEEVKTTVVCGALENGGLNSIELKQPFHCHGLDVCSKRMRSISGVLFLKIL